MKQAPWTGYPCGDSASVDDSTVEALDAVVIAGRTKFSGSRFLLAALVEEVGELAEAIVEGDAEKIRNEALQVAGVAIRIVEEGDKTKYEPLRFVALVAALGQVARGFLQKRAVTWRHSVAKLSSLAYLMGETGDPTFKDITEEEAKT